MNTKKINKPLALGALVAVMGLGTLGVTSGLVSAYGGGVQDSLAASLSEKLDVDEATVRSAFDELREERQAEKQADYTARLQKLVDSGELTEDQKASIESKHSELQTEREEHRAELEAWAKENGIDISYLHMRGGFGAHSKGHSEMRGL